MKPEELATIRTREQYDDRDSWLSGLAAIRDRIALLHHIDALEAKNKELRRALKEVAIEFREYDSATKSYLREICTICRQVVSEGPHGADCYIGDALKEG